jgi:hypothetical protein
MNTLKKIELSEKLLLIHETMKRMHGENWPEASKPYRYALLDAVKMDGEINILQAAIRIGKNMLERGQNPMMILAVAIEIEIEKEDKA